LGSRAGHRGISASTTADSTARACVENTERTRRTPHHHAERRHIQFSQNVRKACRPLDQIAKDALPDVKHAKIRSRPPAGTNTQIRERHVRAKIRHAGADTRHAALHEHMHIQPTVSAH
jgi:hypothetical protein